MQKSNDFGKPHLQTLYAYLCFLIELHVVTYYQLFNIFMKTQKKCDAEIKSRTQIFCKTGKI